MIKNSFCFVGIDMDFDSLINFQDLHYHNNSEDRHFVKLADCNHKFDTELSLEYKRYKSM